MRANLAPLAAKASVAWRCVRRLAWVGALATSGIAIAQPASSAAAAAAATASPYRPAPLAGRAGHYYKVVWGIDDLRVKWTESGEVVRFSWRVLDPGLAATLNAKTLEPSLVDPQAGVSLVIPQLENIGMLRQTSTPQAGRSYWMAFSNKGRLVRKGDRVNVVIGPFRADGLVVE